MTTDWGPWIEHDGKGCPCVGQYFHAVFEFTPGDYTEAEGIAGEQGGYSWDWRYWMKISPDDRTLCARIIRYRLRRPRGMQVLNQILADLPKELEPV